MAKKIFEFEVDGVKRGFRFNMLAFVKAEKLCGCKLSEIHDRIKANDLDTMLNLFTAGAICYAEGEKREIDFTNQDVVEWLEELGDKKSGEVLNDALRTTESKNQEAPTETAGQ